MSKFDEWKKEITAAMLKHREALANMADAVISGCQFVNTEHEIEATYYLKYTENMTEAYNKHWEEKINEAMRVAHNPS